MRRTVKPRRSTRSPRRRHRSGRASRRPVRPRGSPRPPEKRSAPRRSSRRRPARPARPRRLGPRGTRATRALRRRRHSRRRRRSVRLAAGRAVSRRDRRDETVTGFQVSAFEASEAAPELRSAGASQPKARPVAAARRALAQTWTQFARTPRRPSRAQGGPRAAG